MYAEFNLSLNTNNYHSNTLYHCIVYALFSTSFILTDKFSMNLLHGLALHNEKRIDSLWFTRDRGHGNIWHFYGHPKLVSKESRLFQCCHYIKKDFQAKDFKIFQLFINYYIREITSECSKATIYFKTYINPFLLLSRCLRFLIIKFYVVVFIDEFIFNKSI